jgi:hypothetical protein
VQLLKFSSDVVGCSSVGVPVRIYRCKISSSNKSFVGDDVFLEAMPTFNSGVIWLEAHLAERLVIGGVVEVALIIVAAVAATVVATMAPTIAELAWRLMLTKAAITVRRIQRCRESGLMPSPSVACPSASAVCVGRVSPPDRASVAPEGSNNLDSTPEDDATVGAATAGGKSSSCSVTGGSVMLATLCALLSFFLQDFAPSFLPAHQTTQ